MCWHTMNMDFARCLSLTQMQLPMFQIMMPVRCRHCRCQCRHLLCLCGSDQAICLVYRSLVWWIYLILFGLIWFVVFDYVKCLLAFWLIHFAFLFLMLIRHHEAARPAVCARERPPLTPRPRFPPTSVATSTTARSTSVASGDL